MHFDALVTRFPIWSDHVKVVLKVRPRCLCVTTSLIWIPFSFKIGLGAGFSFLDTCKKTVLLALKVTSHVLAHEDNLVRSLFIFAYVS